MNTLTKYCDIKIEQWTELLQSSQTSTWFQTPNAYTFFASLPDIFEPFVIAVENVERLKGVVVGYVTKEGNVIKQYFSRRAIINGGPLLADDITDVELKGLLDATNKYLKSKAIYIETRNFIDYSRWRKVFEECGFTYKPHLNFHVNCIDWDNVENKIGKHRKKYIRLSLRDGARIIDNPTIAQIKEFYSVLSILYQEKVKMPLYQYSFFENLYNSKFGKFLLIEYDNNIIGGSVCVYLEGKAVYEWFACGKDGVYKNIHPSSLTKYAGMKYANENGFYIFDMMGAGSPNEPYGVRDFKAEFGGDLVEYGRFIHVYNKILFLIGSFGVTILKKNNYVRRFTAKI